jgi:hypothetical protein
MERLGLDGALFIGENYASVVGPTEYLNGQ